jgi:phosphoribosylglycinamide formyltransferase-1
VTRHAIVLGCLISGGARTVLNLQREIDAGRLHARIGVVVVTKKGIVGIDRCRAAGLRVVVCDRSRAESLDDQVDAALQAAGVDLVCLCGYLRKFRVGSWAGRALNIHPALLPRHGGRGMYGHHVHTAVLAAGDAESGCTVHLVDDEYDHGGTIVQRRCAVMPGDTPDTLAARVFEQECIAYPAAIGMVANVARASESGS